MRQIYSHKNNLYGEVYLSDASQLTISDNFSTILPQPAAPLPIPKQHFNVLPPRAQNFVGRNKELGQLAKTLEAGKKVVIAGLGGIGKSQIAVEYCYRYRQNHPISYVWWIDAANTAGIVDAYSDIAKTLHLPILGKETLMREVRKWFSQPENGQWLFVFDNVNDPEAIFQHAIDGQTGTILDYLPDNHLGGQIIITSTTKQTADLVSAELIEVDILSSSEARLLIKSYLPQSLDNSTAGELDMLSDTLSRIPLALTQASKYLREKQKTVKEYRSMLQDGSQKAQLLSKHPDPGSQRQYQHTILAVLNDSYTTLQHKHKLGFEMLNIACWFHFADIPESVLRQHCQGDNEMNEVEFDEAILPLTQYFFLEKQRRISDSDEVVYHMHSLVQEAARIFQFDNGLQVASKKDALVLIDKETSPLILNHDWNRLESWLPHVRSIIEWSNCPTLEPHQSRRSLLRLLDTYSLNVPSCTDKAVFYRETGT